MAPSRGQGGQKYSKYENVHPNLVLVPLFERTEVECGKGLFRLTSFLIRSMKEIQLLNTRKINELGFGPEIYGI